MALNGNSSSPRRIVLNAPAVEQSKTENPVRDVVGLMTAPERVVGRASAIDCRYEHALPVYSSRSDHHLSGSIFDALLDSIEMEYWTVDDINDALSPPVADKNDFVNLWAGSWRFMGNVMNCVMEQYIKAMSEDDRERLMERLQSGQAELRQTST